MQNLARVVLATLLLANSSWALEVVPLTEKQHQQLEKDRLFLEQLKFKNVSQAYVRFFGSGGHPSRYVEDRMTKVGYIPQDEKGIVARAGYGMILLTPLYFSRESNLIERLATLVHEVRHLDSESPAHIACPTPYYFRLNEFKMRVEEIEGEKACDSDDHGAYAIHFVFLRAVVDSCTNCSAKMKKQAQDGALEILFRIANPELVQKLVEDTKVHSR